MEKTTLWIIALLFSIATLVVRPISPAATVVICFLLNLPFVVLWVIGSSRRGRRATDVVEATIPPPPIIVVNDSDDELYDPKKDQQTMRRDKKEPLEYDSGSEKDE